MRFCPECGCRLGASAPASKPDQTSTPGNSTVPAEENADELNRRGDRYYNGDGVTQDYSEAVKWYRKAAKQGNQDAQNNLGVCYEDGNSVAKDLFQTMMIKKTSHDRRGFMIKDPQVRFPAAIRCPRGSVADWIIIFIFAVPGIIWQGNRCWSNGIQLADSLLGFFRPPAGGWMKIRIRLTLLLGATKTARRQTLSFPL